LDKRSDARTEQVSLADENSQLKDEGLVGRLVEATAEWMELEAEPLSVDYSEIEQVLLKGCPLIIRLPGESSSRFLAIASASKRYLKSIAPSGKTERVRLETVRDLLCRSADAPLRIDFDQALEEAGVPNR